MEPIYQIMTFGETKYEILQSALTPQLLRQLQIQTQMLEDVVCHNANTIPKMYCFGDPQVANSFAYYGSLASESVLVLIQPLIELAVGKRLHPTYSYMRIYYKDADLKRHTDRPSCEYSATLCIKCDPTNPWPIKLIDANNREVSAALGEGDLLIYKGDELVHWREPCQYDKHIQFFLHYVDADGPHADHKYDTRPMLGLPK